MAVQTPKKTSALPWPALLPLGHHAGKPAISLQKMVMLVGSRHNAHLHLLSRHVSKAHALILSSGGRVYIRDLASREQVYINGVPEREAWLTEGDLIKIGSFTFKYKAGPSMSAAPDAPPEQANLDIAGAEAPIAIAEKVMLIGRRSTCDISLVEDSVSTAHAVIFHVGGKRYIRDLGSRTGTFVNGHKVHQHALEPDDTILIGDTEMRYALASEHDHAITPADAEVEPIDEMDELEDLVGTAPLDMEAEIERDGQVLPAELELQSEAAGEAPAAPKDDLIELEIAHEPQAERLAPPPRAPGKAAPPTPVAAGAPKAPATPQPKPQPVAEPIELEPLELEPVAEAPAPAPVPVPPAAAPREDVKAGGGLPIDDELDRLMNVPEPVEPELVEIDLSTDPDVSDLPNAADTHAIGMEFQQPPAKPTLSANVVDGPVELEPVAEAPAEQAGAPAGEAAGATPAADETKLDATWGGEVLPPAEADATTATTGIEEISPRGGWQGMSRAEEEELEVLTAQGTTPEEGAPVDEAPAIEAPVAEVPLELTPVEEPLDVALPVDEAPAEALPVEPESVSATDAKQKKGRKPRGEKKAKGGRKSKAIEEVATESMAVMPLAEIPGTVELPAETPASEAPAAEASNLEAPAPLEVEPAAPAMEIAGQVEPLEEAGTHTGESATPLEVTADRAIPVDEPVESLPIEGEAEPVAEALPPSEIEEDLAPIDVAPAEDLASESPAPTGAHGEEIAPPVAAEVAAPGNAAPAAETPAAESTAKPAEPTEELSTLEEDELGIAAAFLPPGESAKGDDDIFSGVDETLPVLELDSADLGAAAGSRDPDALLATEESLGDVEVIERTEPTPSSAFDLDLDSAGEPTAEIEEPSLTDSTFGRQVEAFTTTSSGDIVEEEDDLADLPELEAVPDPDEELALILGTDEVPSGLASGETGDTTIDVTAGGIDPAASGVVSDEHLTDQQFGAEGEAVRLETPGLAEADAVLGGQSFVVDAEGHELDEEVQPAEEPSPLDEQSFVAEGEAHAAEQGGTTTAQAPNLGGPAAQAPQRPSNGDGGNFVIGTDLSSFIGGMPLVLPDLSPPPTAFGQVQVSFAGAKAPWEQARRPSFPMGQSLAQEVTDAAEGLRDVEAMEEELEPEPQAEAGEYDEEDDLGEGAPGDEWNVAAAFEDDEEGELVAGQWPGAEGAASEAATSEEAPIEEAAAEETELEELPAEEEHELGAGQSQTEVQPVELNVHAAPETIESLQPQHLETPFDEAEDDSAAGFLELDESEPQAEGAVPEALDEDELMQELTLDDGAVVPETEQPAAEHLDALQGEGGHVDTGHLDTEHVDASIPPLDLSVAPEPPPAPAAPAAPVAKTVAAAAEAPAAPVKPAQPAMVVPPPPARSLRGRKGAEAPAVPAAPVSLTGDSIFGSMEHGNLEDGPFGGGVREVDVFSQGAIGLGDARRAPAAMEGVEGRRPQRAIVPPRMGVLGAGAAAIESESGEPLTRPAYRVIKKKSAAKTVFVVLLIMLVVMGLAIAGIIYFIHPPQTSRGKLHFEHTGALTKLQRDELRKAEFAKLVTPRILLEARTNVAAQSIPAGFLGDPELFAKGLKYEWPEEQPDVMTVSYTGPSDPNDRRRLYALLLAMYEDSHADLDRERQLNANIAKLEKQIQQVQQDRTEREGLKKIVDASPDPAQVKQLEAAAHQADTAYDAAVAAVKDAQLEVKRAETQLPSPGEKSLAASASAKGADPQLRDLQKQLQETASQIASMKSAASEEADAKRKELDQAIERFQATAAEVIKESPQLAQYVQAVQQLQEQTHKLSGELIDVQQQQHKRLSAIKKDIDDRMQARRVELWAADKSLSDLNAQLDLAQRKYNAAIDLNYPVDSKDVKDALAEIRDLSTKIEARKQTLGNDPIVTSVADALQDMINVTKERLEADRKRIEKDIKDQESAFAQSNMVEKLPDTQRAQAAALKAKQEAINGLRREYAAALEKRTTDSNNALRNLEAQVSTLNSQIDERKRQLASDSSRKLTAEEEAQRKAALAQKQAALKDAEDRASVAREAYAKASRALTAAMSQTGDQTAARQKLEAIDQGWQQKEAEERQAQLSLEANKDQLKTLVTIGKPSESNIDVIGSRDDRWLYSAGVAVALSVVFGAIAVFSVSGGDGRLQHPSEEEAEGFDPDAEAGPLAIHEIGRHGPRAKPQAANVPVEGV